MKLSQRENTSEEESEEYVCQKCGACCIVYQITPLYKAEFTRCKYLDEDNECSIHGTDAVPKCCSDYLPYSGMCAFLRYYLSKHMPGWERTEIDIPEKFPEWKMLNVLNNLMWLVVRAYEEE